ncbi:MAG: hypothetical protein FWG78_03820 [Coriobacteriia bacterium]|nr:hypothetical protein [Coriobacteriia bacterium]
MDKKNRFLFGILLSICVISMLVLLGCNQDLEEELIGEFNIIAPTHGNYNNYTFINFLDYENNMLYWIEASLFSTQLIEMSDDEKRSVFGRVGAPVQVWGNHIFFKERPNMKVLHVRDMNTGKDSKLADNVDKFLVLENYIIYSTVPTFDHDMNLTEENELIALNYRTGEREALVVGVREFCVSNGEIIILLVDEPDRSNVPVIKISLDDFSEESLFAIEPRGFPFVAMMQKDRLLVCPTRTTAIDLWDVSTGEQVSIPVPTENTYADVVTICDDGTIFASFEAFPQVDLLLPKQEDRGDGLWHIDPDTLELTHLSSEVYDSLYLFDGQLFGMRGNEVFKIDNNTGEYVKIN